MSTTPLVAVKTLRWRVLFRGVRGKTLRCPRTKGTAVSEWVHSFVDFCLIPLKSTTFQVQAQICKDGCILRNSICAGCGLIIVRCFGACNGTSCAEATIKKLVIWKCQCRLFGCPDIVIIIGHEIRNFRIFTENDHGVQQNLLYSSKGVKQILKKKKNSRYFQQLDAFNMEPLHRFFWNHSFPCALISQPSSSSSSLIVMLESSTSWSSSDMSEKSLKLSKSKSPNIKSSFPYAAIFVVES